MELVRYCMEAASSSLVAKASSKKSSGDLPDDFQQAISEHNSSNPLDPSELDNAMSESYAEPLDVGTVLLNRYMLMRLIAQGGASTIYRARDMLAVLGDKEDQSYIAVKVVLNSNETAGENQQLVLREALTTRHLSHPNILKVFDYHKDDDISFVTMEYVDGESLSDYVKRLPQKKLPYYAALAILKAVSAALQAAHEQGVVHSDVKPSNILITESGNVKVIDFATARTLIDQSQKGKLQKGSLATRRGLRQESNAFQLPDSDDSFFGYTLAYASPETIADKPATASDDVFSFACIIYEIIAGKHPYGRKPTNTISEDFRLIKPREIGFWQWQVLKKALQLKSEQRIQSVKTLMLAFQHARYFMVYLVAAIALVIGAVILGNWGAEQLRDTQQNSVNQAATVQQQNAFDSVIANLKQLPVEEQLSQFSTLEEFTAIQKSSAIAQLQSSIVTGIDDRVERAITTVEPKDAFAVFAELQKTIQQAQVIYPDSLSLYQSLVALKAESSQLQDTQVYALQQAWQNTNFSQQSINEIKRLEGVLSASSVIGAGDSNNLSTASGNEINTLAPNRAVIETYQTAVLDAIETLDIASVNRLFEFSLAFENIPDFRNVWRVVDKGFVIGAQEWMQYSTTFFAANAASENQSANVSRATSTNNSYPQLTLRYYVMPYFAAMDEQIETVWADKDLIQLKDQLIQGSDQYLLSSDMPIVTKTKSNLIEKIDNKIRYYKNRNDRKSEIALNDVKAELQF